ncbi:MAG TPA: mandelate racemase/muconate lactonizing enzyme family protein [candidate division Zixibacteria bacterium]|nr:mandelate racemase/muconate lactonizing enzyme family protein [candidate division Zixibacteria bacterium]
MRITGVRAALYRAHNIITGWKVALGGRDVYDLVFVRIDADDGSTGVGLSSPGALYLTGDTAAGHLYLINEVFGPAIVGADPFDVEAIMLRLDSLAARAEPAKSGVDLALFDLMGKAAGLPACKLLGGAVRTRVRVTRLMGMYPPREMAEKVKPLVSRGCSALKLKVGTTLAEDVERVKAVREAVGPSVMIAVDFNQVCSVKEAIRRIEAMEPYDVALVEQPVKAGDVKGMAEVKKRVRTRIMADESVNTVQDALRIIEADAADVISLKLPKLGGLLKARKAAALCEAAGVEYLVGTTPGSRLIDAANVHLAASLKDLALPCEIGEFERMADDPCTGLEIVDGFLAPPARPGLGVDLDLKKVGLAE